MYHKSRSYRRHQNKRIIARRKRHIKTWGFGFSAPEGRLRKYNLSCNCGMCSVKHPLGVKKAVDSYKNKQLKKVHKQLMEDYSIYNQKDHVSISTKSSIKKTIEVKYAR